MPEASLSSLLARWEEARARGVDLSAAELCHDCPELAGEVAVHLDGLRRLNALFAQAQTGGDKSGSIDPTLDGVSGVEGARMECVPGYQILEELGRGGMGVVYRARQVALNREVALKMILAGDHAGSQERARFLAEAETIASLSHPAVVQIYDFGNVAGLPYFAMELCAAGSLATRLAAGPLPPREAAEVVARIAEGVQAAHERGIVHRDLKPGNVFLSADGLPKVGDFGLSRREGRAQLTRSSSVMGTPAYMAPEQVRSSKGVGPLADVYALGAILYECLTGRPPFVGETIHDALMQVMSEAARPPREVNAAVPAGLEAVCLKCLAKEPHGRYASAREMAEDLRRFLYGEPVRAEAARPRRRRRRQWVWVAAACVLLAGAGVVFALSFGGREANEKADQVGETRDTPGPGEGSHGADRFMLDVIDPVDLDEKPIDVPPFRPLVNEKPVHFNRRHALLIGVNDYSAAKENDDTPINLHWAAADMEGLARVFRPHFRTVRVLADTRSKQDRPDAENIKRAIRELVTGKTREDLVVIALEGHGMIRARGRVSEQFFLPCDADTSRPNSLVNIDALITDLGKCGAGAGVVLLDMGRKYEGKGAIDRGAPLPLPQGVGMLFSCSRGQSSFEPKPGYELRNSFFYGPIIEAMNGKARTEDGNVTLARLAAYVNEQMPPVLREWKVMPGKQDPELRAQQRHKRPF